MVDLTAQLSYGGRAVVLIKPRSKSCPLHVHIQIMEKKRREFFFKIYKQNLPLKLSKCISNELVPCIMTLIAIGGKGPARVRMNQFLRTVFLIASICLVLRMKVSTFSVRFDLDNRQIFLERLNGLQEIELNSRSKLFPQLFNILLVYFHHVWAQRRKKKRLHYSSSLLCLFSPFLSAVISLHLSSSPGPPEQKAQDAAPDSVWLIEHIKAIAEVNIPLFLFLLFFFSWNTAVLTRHSQWICVKPLQAANSNYCLHFILKAANVL